MSGQFDECPAECGDRWLGMEKRIIGRSAFYYPSKNIGMSFLLRKALNPF